MCALSVCQGQLHLYYARFHVRSYLKCRENQTEVKINKDVKYRSRATGQGACLKGTSRIISLQGFTQVQRRPNFDV